MQVCIVCMSVWSTLCIMMDNRELDYAAQVVTQLSMPALLLPTATAVNITITKTSRVTSNQSSDQTNQQITQLPKPRYLEVKLKGEHPKCH